MTRKILIGLAAVIVLFLIVVATRPADFRVERSATIAATPAMLFGQVNDHHKFAAWNPFVKLDPNVGGKYRMSFTNFTNGQSHSFGGEYLELRPHERIRKSDRFDDPNLPGEMQVTIDLKSVSCGTALDIVQEAVRLAQACPILAYGAQTEVRPIVDLCRPLAEVKALGNT